MSETHDFNDGYGPVPAHRHSNGGGWVAYSAKVDASAYVGPDAWVYGNARVYGNAEVFGNAEVYGDAQVFGDDNAAKIAELTRKLDALRNEVKAWRDWDANCGVELHPNNIKRCSCEGLNRVENVLNARQATDTLNALEDER
jgi:hypothetical protein